MHTLCLQQDDRPFSNKPTNLYSIYLHLTKPNARLNTRTDRKQVQTQKQHSTQHQTLPDCVVYLLVVAGVDAPSQRLSSAKLTANGHQHPPIYRVLVQSHHLPQRALRRLVSWHQVHLVVEKLLAIRDYANAVPHARVIYQLDLPVMRYLPVAGQDACDVRVVSAVRAQRQRPPPPAR